MCKRASPKTNPPAESDRLLPSFRPWLSMLHGDGIQCATCCYCGFFVFLAIRLIMEQVARIDGGGVLGKEVRASLKEGKLNE